jgi:peroxiredoxin
VYVINPDTADNNKKVREASHLAIPILLDPGYTVAKMLDLPGQGRPMNGLVGFVVIDGKGTIRLQRVDIDFGSHAGQIIEIVKIVSRTGG